MSYKVNDVPHTQHVALARVERKLLREEVEACVVLGGVVCNGIAEAILEVEMPHNRRKLAS